MNFKEILSPMGIAMIFLAGVVDVSEVFAELIPVVGQIISVFIDIFALVFIGGWMWLRSKSITTPKKTALTLEKLRKFRFLKRLKWINAIFELTPIISSVFPCWVIAVLAELISTPEETTEEKVEETPEAEVLE